MRTRTAYLSSLALCSVLAAQGRSWVVDINGGAGSHFIDLRAAITAANHGDTLYVRSGRYSSAYLRKGLTILCTSGVEFDITVHALPHGRTAAVKNVASGSVFIRDCQGRVLIEDVRLPKAAYTGATCIVTQSTDVHFHRVQANSIYVWRSVATINQCDILSAALNGGVGIDESIATLAACNVRGGAFYNRALSAVSVVNRAVVTITDDGTRTIRTIPDPTSTTPTIYGDSTSVLVLDPRVTLQTPNATAPRVSAALKVRVRTVPVLTANGAPPGGTVRTRLAGRPADTFALAVGTLSQPIPMRGYEEIWWIGGPALRVMAVGSMGTTGRAGVDVPVPRDPALLGRLYAWQGIAGTTARGYTLSNPVGYVHGL